MHSATFYQSVLHHEQHKDVTQSFFALIPVRKVSVCFTLMYLWNNMKEIGLYFHNSCMFLMQYVKGGNLDD